MDIEIHTTTVNIKVLIIYMDCFLVRIRFIWYKKITFKRMNKISKVYLHLFN